MKQIICEECGKVLEGYTERHVQTLLKQHQIKHQNEEQREKEKCATKE